MLSDDIRQQVRRLEVLARRRVTTTLAGAYQSKFRGTGLELDRLRVYQPGDDVRSIDWKTTARMNTPFVKIFQEEREQILLVVLDVSDSGQFGPGTRSKRDVAFELAALFGHLALVTGDRFGLVTFAGDIEVYHRPAKGRAKLQHALYQALEATGNRQQTNLEAALAQVLHTQQQRANVIILSDFYADNYQGPLKTLARKHDVHCIQLVHPAEARLPSGLLPAQTLEGEHRQVVFGGLFGGQKKRSTTLPRPVDVRSLGVEHLRLDVSRPYIDALVRHFARRR
ncbi:MAG: DUF58 domain-containing protein [Bacteroidota bacterium]